jgi:hypothetical protein
MIRDHTMPTQTSVCVITSESRMESTCGDIHEQSVLSNIAMERVHVTIGRVHETVGHLDEIHGESARGILRCPNELDRFRKGYSRFRYDHGIRASIILTSADG